MAGDPPEDLELPPGMLEAMDASQDAAQKRMEEAWLESSKDWIFDEAVMPYVGPPVGATIRTLGSVYADPDGTGYLVTKVYDQKLPPGTEGVIEVIEKAYGNTYTVVVLFPGDLRARLGPTAYEVLPPQEP